MFEYLVNYNGEEIEIYGYSLKDACKRANIDLEDISVLNHTYID